MSRTVYYDANGKGKLCHSGEISCCAPHHWWAFEKKGENK